MGMLNTVRPLTAGALGMGSCHTGPSSKQGMAGEDAQLQGQEKVQPNSGCPEEFLLRHAQDWALRLQFLFTLS